MLYKGGGMVLRGVRKEIQGLLSKMYDFWAITPKERNRESEFLKADFRRVLGRVYKPFEDVGGRSYYMLAMEKATKQEEKASVTNWLSKAFLVKGCELTSDPVAVLAPAITEFEASEEKGGGFNEVYGVQVVYAKKGSIYEAIKKSGLCPCPIDECKYPDSVKILIVPHTNSANMFRVKNGTACQGPIGRDELNGYLDYNFVDVTLPFCDEYYVWQVEEV